MAQQGGGTPRAPSTPKLWGLRPAPSVPSPESTSQATARHRGDTIAQRPPGPGPMTVPGSGWPSALQAPARLQNHGEQPATQLHVGPGPSLSRQHWGYRAVVLKQEFEGVGPPGDKRGSRLAGGRGCHLSMGRRGSTLCACTHIHVHTHRAMCAHMRTHMHTQTCMHTCMCRNTYRHVCTQRHADMNAHVQTHTDTCTNTCK